MKRLFKIGLSTLLSAVLMLASVMTVSADGTGTIEVTFQGYNVKAADGTTGAGAASADTDYTTTLTVRDGCEMSYIGVCDEEYNYLSYTYDGETGQLTIDKEQLADVTEIWIEATAKRSFAPDTDVTAVTSLPYSESFAFSEDNMIKEFSQASKLYEMELEAGDFLLIECIGADSSETDTLIVIFTYNTDNQLEQYNWIDYDSNGYGETYLFEVIEGGTYVIALQCYDYSIGDNVNAEFALMENVDLLPDFTIEPVPTPDADALWSWDAATKTLTLKDGFATYNMLGEGICLPADARVIVEGDAEIMSRYEGIWSQGALDIELKPGANLVIEPIEADGVEIETGNLTITGTADAEGNLPKLTVKNASDDGLDVVYNGAIIINNCMIDITCSSEGIRSENGSVSITDSHVTIDCVSEGIYTYFEDYDYDTGETVAPPEGESYDVTVVNSVLNISAQEEVIQTYYGDIILTDCDTNLYTDDEEGLHAYIMGDIKVSGGRLIIKSEENAIETDDGTVSLEDVSLFLYGTADYDIIVISDVTGFSIPGTFEMYSADRTLIYSGEWAEELITYGHIVIDNGDGTYSYPAIIYTTFEGDKADNAVTGVESEYIQGDSIEFTAVGGGEGLAYPVHGNTCWSARNWQIVDTELSGLVDDTTGAVDTSTLEPGTYTLKVNFEQKVYTNQYWAWYTNASEEHRDSIEIQFTVTAKDTDTDHGDDSDTSQNNNQGDNAGSDEGNGSENTAPEGDGEQTDIPTAPSTGGSFSTYMWLAVISVSGISAAALRRKNR